MRVVMMDNVHGSMRFNGSIPKEFLEKLQVSRDGELLVTTKCKLMAINIDENRFHSETELQFVAQEATLQIIDARYNQAYDIANASEICKPRLSKEEEGAFW